MSYTYGSNVFLGATVASLSEEGANVDDNAIVNNTDYWESGDPVDLAVYPDGDVDIDASSEDGINVANRAFDGNGTTYWIAILEVHAPQKTLYFTDLKRISPVELPDGLL